LAISPILLFLERFAPGTAGKEHDSMGMDGISQELQTVDGEDQRLNKRFAEVPGALSQYPHVSIPAACGGHAATMAAYRFFENPKTNLENILQPHRHATQERLAAQDVVLCVQDTTELDLTRPQQQIRGLGPVGKGSTRRGAYLHLLTAFTPDGTPLGTPGHKYIVQEDKTPEEKTPEEKTLKKIVQKHHPGQRKVIVGGKVGGKPSSWPPTIRKQLAFASATVNRIFSKSLPSKELRTHI